MQVKSITESAILLTFIKPSFIIKIFVLSIFEWPLTTGFTVLYNKVKCVYECVECSGSVGRMLDGI